MLKYADLDREEFMAGLNSVIDAANRAMMKLATLANAAGQTLTVANFLNAVQVRGLAQLA
jgi:hypothetical protein